MTEFKREIWTVEHKRFGVIKSHSKSSAELAAREFNGAERGSTRVVRYVPEPQWHKFDPENPPEPGDYRVSFGDGETLVLKWDGKEWLSCGWFSGEYVCVPFNEATRYEFTADEIVSYTDLPKPPEVEA